MRHPSFIYRDFVAIGHAHMTKSGKFDGNFLIQAVTAFGEIVFRTTYMVECDSRDEAFENICIVAEAWIDKHIEAGGM